jgi:hypothetical protein
MQRNTIAFLVKTQPGRFRNHTTFGLFISIQVIAPPEELTMNKKCPQCGLINYPTAQSCIRCGRGFGESENIPSNRSFLKSSLMRRAVVCVLVIMAVVVGFYSSLLLSADALSTDERERVEAAIRILDEKGFSEEVFLLRHLAAFRANDNWLNASVEKENAYAATNFPFEIVTIYPDFFTYPADDTERAAILLHEAKHLQGKDEKDAFEFVWRNRRQLGWTAEAYSHSVIWRETRKLTREYLPSMFVCDFNDSGDCTG